MSEPDADTDAAGASALFSPRRLRLARETRMMTRTAVALAAQVTPAAVSQFERGDARPVPQTLLRLAGALDFPVKFFAVSAMPSSREGALLDEEQYDQGYFRSLRSIAVTDRRRALALSHLVHDLADRLNQTVRLPDRDVPPNPVHPEAGPAAAEDRANEIRAAWGIPPGPIPNVVREMERHGVVCARYHAGTQDVDAFSVPFPDWPVAVLGDDKAKRDRERFSAAHELGHLVMHDIHDAGSKAIEDQANRFAAAFLMPASDIRTELPATASWRDLVMLKRRWGASIGALLRRAMTLNVMPETTYLQAVRHMSGRGWRINEPGDLGAGEAPQLLSLAASAAEQAGLTISTLASETGWPEPMIIELLSASTDPRPQIYL
jgi:Zn-dependent peptidase ImmA (M78 family)/transcriptional regulator with XRE-family HTH domain